MTEQDWDTADPLMRAITVRTYSRDGKLSFYGVIACLFSIILPIGGVQYQEVFWLALAIMLAGMLSFVFGYWRWRNVNNYWGDAVGLYGARQDAKALRYFLDRSGKTIKELELMDKTDIENIARRLLSAEACRLDDGKSRHHGVGNKLGFRHLAHEADRSLEVAHGHLLRLGLVEPDINLYLPPPT